MDRLSKVINNASVGARQSMKNVLYRGIKELQPNVVYGTPKWVWLTPSQLPIFDLLMMPSIRPGKHFRAERLNNKIRSIWPKRIIPKRTMSPKSFHADGDPYPIKYLMLPGTPRRGSYYSVSFPQTNLTFRGCENRNGK